MNVRIDRKNTRKAVPYECFEKCMELKELVLYMALREEFGFGRERLERVYHAAYRIYTEYRNRYCRKEDLKEWRITSPDGEAMKAELLTCGFDYDGLNRALEKEIHKYRFHGNQFTEDKT